MNKFESLVREIADELEGWTYKPRTDDYSSHYEQIASESDGAIIALTSRCTLYGFDEETARIEIYGKYPTHNGKQKHISGGEPRITVAAKRGAVAIAKDITKRFLPKYLPLYEEAAAWVQQKVRADDRDAANLAAIATALGVDAPKPDSKRVKLPYSEGRCWGHFEAGYDGTFSVDLHNVSLDTAVAIAQILRES